MVHITYHHQLKKKLKPFNTSASSLLCAVLLNAQSPGVIAAQENNMRAARNSCDWAFVAYKGNQTQLDVFSSIASQLQVTGFTRNY